MHTSQLPSIATQQARRIEQYEEQTKRQNVTIAKADAVSAAARRSALSDPNGDLAKALQVYDRWLKELEHAPRPTA